MTDIGLAQKKTELQSDIHFGFLQITVLTYQFAVLYFFAGLQIQLRVYKFNFSISGKKYVWALFRLF